MAQKKSRGQLETELLVLRSAKRSEGLVALGRDVLKWPCLHVVVCLSVDRCASRKEYVSEFQHGLVRHS